MDKNRLIQSLLCITVLALAMAAGILFGRFKIIQRSAGDFAAETALATVDGSMPEAETIEPSPEPKPGPIDYTVTAMLTNLYRINSETGEARKYCEIARGTILNVFDEFENCYICSLEGTDDVFCVEKSHVKEGVFYVEPKNGVDLRFVLPDAVYDILFASERNITGHAMYPAIPMLETRTAEMLKKAADLFAADGYTVKIYDSYRPKSAQYELYDIVQDARFIADPYVNNSFHQIGRAVDMSLINGGTGMELKMPTPMHTFNESAARYNRAAWTEEERQNVDYMTDVMKRCGFRTIETEWWHFENGEAGDYMDPNLYYESLPLIPAEMYQERFPQYSE